MPSLRLAPSAAVALAAALALLAPPVAGAQDAPCYQPGAYLPLVANPGEPAGTCLEVEVLQGWAFVIRTEPAPRTLTVGSLHDPEAPEQVAAFPLPEGAQQLRAQDSHLYFTSVDGYDAHLHIWDVTLPTAHPSSAPRSSSTARCSTSRCAATCSPWPPPTSASRSSASPTPPRRCG